jgi:hypothetical protein
MSFTVVKTAGQFDWNDPKVVPVVRSIAGGAADTFNCAKSVVALVWSTMLVVKMEPDESVT